MPVHVLVYDHSATILANFHYVLMQAGFRVTARFPRELEPEQARKHAPDVLLVALTQETYHGTLKRAVTIHDDPTLVHIPIVFAVPDDQQIPVPDDIAGTQIVTYRQKPFQIDAVIATIRALTDSS